jgi:hypothetical protein
MFNDSPAIYGKSVSMVLLVMEARDRPSVNDKTNLLVLLDDLKEIKSSNIGVVYTICD